LSQSRLEELHFGLPPLREQERILEAAEELAALAHLWESKAVYARDAARLVSERLTWLEL
jgi:hypothetical protein